MSKVMRIAGRTDAATVKGIRVADDGEVCTARTWKTDVTVLKTVELRDTSAVQIADNLIDAGQYGQISLRVSNSHDAPITLNFYEDIKDQPARWLCDANGNPLSVVIPSTDRLAIITPDDVPALNYIKNVALRIAADKAPTTGSTTIWLVGKR